MYGVQPRTRFLHLSSNLVNHISSEQSHQSISIHITSIHIAWIHIAWIHIDPQHIDPGSYALRPSNNGWLSGCMHWLVIMCASCATLMLPQRPLRLHSRQDTMSPLPAKLQFLCPIGHPCLGPQATDLTLFLGTAHAYKAALLGTMAGSITNYP